MMLEDELRGLSALFGALMMTIGNTFPAVKARRAISPFFTVLIIIIAIGVGAAVVYAVVFFNAGATTTTISTYP
jgi:hypothetical protein